MGAIQAQRWCKLCERKTLHARPAFSDGVGCLLTVLTLGLFLPVWLAIKVVEAVTTRWRCQVCGRARVT
jgi:ribosomal protein L44E